MVPMAPSSTRTRLEAVSDSVGFCCGATAAHLTSSALSRSTFFIVEIHFEVDAVATNVVEQRAEFVEGYPTGHDALAAFEDLPIEVVPFG